MSQHNCSTIFQFFPFQIVELKRLIADRNSKLAEAHIRSDNQIMQIRVILDKSEREHQREMDAETAKRDEFAGEF